MTCQPPWAASVVVRFCGRRGKRRLICWTSRSIHRRGLCEPRRWSLAAVSGPSQSVRLRRATAGRPLGRHQKPGGGGGPGGGGPNGPPGPPGPGGGCPNGPPGPPMPGGGGPGCPGPGGGGGSALATATPKPVAAIPSAPASTEAAMTFLTFMLVMTFMLGRFSRLLSVELPDRCRHRRKPI
jgi:hypothetical protein